MANLSSTVLAEIVFLVCRHVVVNGCAHIYSRKIIYFLSVILAWYRRQEESMSLIDVFY